MTSTSSRKLSSDLKAHAQAVGDQLGIPGAIHENDYIFWFIYDEPRNADKKNAVSEYLQSGGNASQLVQSILGEARVAALLTKRPNAHEPASFLDFASGYGRVTRYFSLIPQLKVSACDIHAEAVSFMQALGYDAFPSSDDPDTFRLPKKFNIIFAFSFFTHMPRESWGKWLAALKRHLEPNGILIFTTHGEVSQGLMGVPALERDGFFFHQISEQRDLSTQKYGNSVTSFDYAYSSINDNGLKLVQFKQAGAGHHDFYVVTRCDGAPLYHLKGGMPRSSLIHNRIRKRIFG